MELDELHSQFGWGHLQDHDMDCPDCDGTGLDDFEGSCTRCEGEGTVSWGSFYVADTGDCAFCEKQDVPIADMYENADTGRGWVCLPCYLSHHKGHNCCDLWKEAEEAFGLSTSAQEESEKK